MSTIEALAKSIVTPAGIEIAERVALMIGQGLPVGAAVAVAAELGLTQGRAEGVDLVHARLSNQAKHGEPR